MLFKTSQHNIIIDIPSQYTKIGIKASGGLDSTILSYMLALYKRDERPDIDIIPVTLIESTKPFQFMYSSMSLQKISELTGITFGTHYFNMVHTHLISEGQDDLLMSLYNDEILDCHYYGVTLNPPDDAFQNQHGADPERVPLPDGKLHPVVDNETNFQPFVNIDKKGIYELYDSLGVLDELFSLTHSCEMIHGKYLMQLDLSKHCGINDCWWCQERLWGFGRLD
jgi:hypothetical protein